MSKYDLNRSVPQSLVRKHSEISNWKSLSLIFTLYIFTFGAIWIQSFNFHRAISLLTLFFIAGVQHHIMTLMHEGAHHLIHPNKKVNDCLSQAFCSFPLGVMLKDYRYFHLMHHKHSGDSENDPEIKFYQKTFIGYGLNGNRVLKSLINDISGLATIRSLIYITRFNQEKMKEGKIRAINFWDIKWGLIGLISILSVPFLFGILKYFVTFWMLSYLFVLPLLVRWHAVGEHTGMNAPCEQDKTLTHNFNPLVNFFLYPITSGFHLEHHLFAQIPWYNMKAFRKELMDIEKYQIESMKLEVDGYWFGKKSVRKLVLQNN